MRMWIISVTTPCIPVISSLCILSETVTFLPNEIYSEVWSWSAYPMLNAKPIWQRGSPNPPKNPSVQHPVHSPPSFGCFGNIVRILHCLVEGQEDGGRSSCSSTHISEPASSCLSDREQYSQAYRAIMMHVSITRKFFPTSGIPRWCYRGRLHRHGPISAHGWGCGALEGRLLFSQKEDRSSVVHKYLEEVKAGKTEIEADTLLPHETYAMFISGT